MTIAVLFTGSRYARMDFLDHKKIIWNALLEVERLVNPPGRPRTDILLFEGECKGADLIARKSGEALGWRISPHPADWTGPCTDTCPPRHRKKYKTPKSMTDTTFCPFAGHRRNQEMVDKILAEYPLGAICVATPLGDYSAGTQDCISRARKAFGDAAVTVRKLPPVPTRAQRMINATAAR